MNDTVIEKRESRSSKSKEWRMSNGNGHFLNLQHRSRKQITLAQKLLICAF